MSRSRTLLFAVAGGAAVANLYLAQPLLGFIGADFNTAAANAGWLITVTQISYALGIFLLVPLGDVLDRRRLIPAMMLLGALALLVCALTPSLGAFMIAVTVLGVSTVSAQLLIPLAGDLADALNRGKVVGIVVAGTLIGILLSRVLGGLMADIAGWRSVFVFASVLDVILAVVVFRAIPRLSPRRRIPYWSLIASVGSVVRRNPAALWTLVLGATAFGSFTMFWTALTFLLSGAPFYYPVSTIGLFGLVGLAGALVAQPAGRLHDRGRAVPATGVGCVLLFVAFMLGAFAERSVLLVVLAVVLLDVAFQVVNILNQARVLAVCPEARSRLNTAFVVSLFLGGAVGSAGASLLWAAGGWTAVMLAGAGASVFALVVWAIGRRSALRHAV